MKTSLIVTHLCGSIITTVVLLVVYASVQQSYRTTANDPQIQIARDVRDALIKGKSRDQVLSKDTVDLNESLSVFEEIFDKNGKPMQSTGFINNELPQLPSGVFEFTSLNNEDVLTWQPQSDVRVAMVVEKVNSPVYGFVGVGRSLKETEGRESNLLKMICIAWVISMLAIIINLIVQIYLLKKLNKKQ